MNSWLISCVVLACVTLETSALFPGACPVFTPQADFDPERMDGTWYGVAAAKHGLPLENVKCVTNDYSYSPEDGSLTVILTQTSVADNQRTSIYVPSKPIDGVPNHAIIEGEMGQGPFKQTFTILYTDYNSKVLTVICADNGENHGYGVQVYSREPTLAPEELQEVKAVLQQEGIPEDLTPIDQNCDLSSDEVEEEEEEERTVCALLALALAAGLAFFVGK